MMVLGSPAPHTGRHSNLPLPAPDLSPTGIKDKQKEVLPADDTGSMSPTCFAWIQTTSHPVSLPKFTIPGPGPLPDV